MEGLKKQWRKNINGWLKKKKWCEQKKEGRVFKKGRKEDGKWRKEVKGAKRSGSGGGVDGGGFWGLWMRGSSYIEKGKLVNV